LLKDILIIFLISVFIIFVFSKLKIPSIVGFLITGALIGPYGLQALKGIHEVEIMAEVGVILLLFAIGIEFSLESLLRIKKEVMLGGFLQVASTTIISLIFFYFINFSINKSLYFGFIISLSSTAIVLKLFQEKGQVDTPHGKVVLAILIFQDIIAIPMMLVIPLLSNIDSNNSISFLEFIFKVTVILSFLILSTKLIIPKLLYQIIKTKIKELFLLTLALICIGTAWLTSYLGLSLALGAFIAGLIISESEYSHEALGHILPFKDIFTSFFFVSIGMLLNISFFIENISITLIITFLIIIFKFIIVNLISGILGYSIRTATICGIALAQIGEFSFVLSKVGLENKLMSDIEYQIFLSSSILTMILTPFLLKYSEDLSTFLFKLPISDTLMFGIRDKEILKSNIYEDHLVIVGFGINGQNLAKVSKKAKIPYIIVETNPDTVKKYKEKGEKIYYGDISNPSVLEHINIKNARIAVIAISDPSATRKAIHEIRKICKNVYIIVRTRYINEINDLINLGADQVISEEFETSIEIFARVLNKYLVPKEEIETFIREIREANYSMLRTHDVKLGTKTLNELNIHLNDFEINSIRINKNSFLVNKTLKEISLRKNYGVTLLAINRDGHVLTNPSPDIKFKVDDILLLLGKTEELSKIENILY